MANFLYHLHRYHKTKTGQAFKQVQTLYGQEVDEYVRV